MILTRRAVLASTFAGLAVRSIGTASAEETPRTVLRLQRRTIEVNGKAAAVYGIVQPDGTHGAMFRVGDKFRVTVENQIAEPSLIHWHGMTPPWQQDGVPGISGPPIAPGQTADYDFPLTFGGTYWMHSHQGLQEQLLMSAPLIIHDDRNELDQQEIIVMLHDFSFTPPEEIYAKLRKPVKMASMAMKHDQGPDLNDVTYDAFLANDRTLSDPETIKVERGGRALLRVINGPAMSNFHLDIGALDGELIAVDGFKVKPVAGKAFPIAVAQRLDIRLRLPAGAGAYPILAILEGTSRRTGIVLDAGAMIAKMSDTAEKIEPAITLDLERRLEAVNPLSPRKADRTHRLDLTGDMEKYVWSINGVVWTKDTPPLPVAEGERVELVLTNKTMMPHPMHLHGHEFQVVEIDGKRISGAVRDTILVRPMGQVVVAFDANNPGWWAFHCHLLYHLDAGMFTTFRYI
jgi:FtsP/CotA-like multicopper oxidase with cupredoxin domain